MNPKESKENDGKVPCPYCHKKFKRLAMHKPHCRSKPDDKKDLKYNEKQLSTDDTDDKNDGRVPCPYCYKKFKSLAKHKQHCRSKPDEKSSLKNNEKQLSTDDTRDDDDGRVPCPYCHEMFKRLDLHIAHCRSKHEDKPSLKNNEKQLSTDYTHYDDDGRVLCPYCHKIFKRLDLHIAHCRSKHEDKPSLKNNEKQLSIDYTRDDHDGTSSCDYCRKKFNRLDLHITHCPSKPGDKDSLKNNEKQLSTDDTRDDDDGSVPCPYCHEMFKRLDMHIRHCRSNPESPAEICEYCEESFQALAIHQPYCDAILFNSNNKDFNKFIKSLKLRRKQIDIKNIKDSMDRIKRQLNYETNKRNTLKWNILNSGSYYSRVKVSKPDEFDFMFCPTRVQCRIELDTEHPCYCKVFITNKDELPEGFSDLLESSDEIIPSKYKEFCFKIFESITKDKRLYKRIENDMASPAYTVQYNEGTNKDFVPDFDWVPCLKVETMPEFFGKWKTRKLTDEEKSDAGIYVVAKDLLVDDKLYDLWRLSFSTLEKKIIREKCKNDDHQVIRCIKKILGEVKDDNSKLCSYHIVTHCLHCFEEIKEKPDFKEYTINVMNLLIDRLKSRSLPHFFIPKFNLLREVSQKECEQFIEKLDFYKYIWTR